MLPIIEFKSSNQKIGLKARTPSNGPEQIFIDEFAFYLCETFKNINGGIAIFYEPLLETGFPDIVFVQYNPNVYDRWNIDRSKLFSTDLKVLHHLVCKNGLNSDCLRKQLGIDSKTLITSIERLLDGGLIKRKNNLWKPYGFNKLFAIKRIIAVEAKIKNLKSAVQQAEINRWFASESYIVSPVDNPSEGILKYSKISGVGIYSFNKKSIRRIAKSARFQLPCSYASWMFNEWIGRYLQ